MARSTPVHRSLHEVKNSWGAEFLFTLGNVTVCAIMMLGPRLLWWPVMTWGIQKVLQWNFKRDPQMSEVLAGYISEGDRYDPWPRPHMKRKRPYGLGRDLPLC